MSGRYNHAPITSAILEVKAEQPEDRSAPFFRNDAGLEVPGYPTRQIIQGVQAQFTINPTPSGPAVGTAASQTPVRVLYHSSDQKQFFRLTPEGFTFVRLNPYENRKSFISEARRIWEMCWPGLKSVGRVGLRYINRLDLPLPVRDFKDYLRTVPEISPDMPSIFVQNRHGITAFLDVMMNMLIVNDISRGVSHVAIRTTPVSN